MPTWPETLPQVSLIDGLSYAPVQNVVAFATETGPGKLRRRSTARSKVVTMRFLLDETQRATFLAFFEDDLEDGALTFELDDPVTGELAKWRFDPASPYSLTTPGRPNWSLSMNLLQVP